MAENFIARQLKSWEDYRPTKTLTFWIAAGSVGAALIIGFGPGGWTTGANASKMAAEAALEARQQLAAAVCVEEFMEAADARQRLDKLRNAAYYQRGDLVAADGWATMPDKSEPNFAVAKMCAHQLSDLKAPAL